MPVNELKQDNLKTAKFVLNSLVGIAIGIGTFFIIILIFTLILTNQTNLDEKIYAFPMGCVAIALGSLVAGFITSMKNKSKGLISGVVCSLLFFFVLFLLSIIILRAFRDNSIANMGFLKTIIMFFIILLPCTVGGVMGVNMVKRKRKK